MSSSRDHLRGVARSSQMSMQEEIIAKKREEIQAKLKQAEGGGGVANATATSATSNASVFANKLHKKSGGVHPGAKNRWGFKGKPKSSAPPPPPPAAAVKTTPTTPAASVSGFSNDGSFMEQFKRMQREKEEKDAREKKEQIEEEQQKLERQRQRQQQQEDDQEEEEKRLLPSNDLPRDVKTEVKEEQPPVQEQRKSKSRFGGFVSGGQMIPGAPLPTGPSVAPAPPTAATSFSQAPSSPGPSTSSSSSVPVAVSKSTEEQWFKAALDKARTIAQSIAKPSTAEPTLSQVPELVVPKVEEDVKHNIEDKVGEAPPKTEPSTAAGSCSSSTSASSSSAPSSSSSSSFISNPLPTIVDELAMLVAVNGEEVEIMARNNNLEENQLLFLQDPESELYKRYKARVLELRSGFKDESRRAQRRSRWGSETEKVDVKAPISIPVPGTSSLTSLRRSDPALIQYALKVFGTTDIEDHQWKQCEDQIKMNMVYRDILAKQQEEIKLEQMGKRKYEYDSDEDTEGGTWEHKARKMEMDKTASKAQELTQSGKGSHHIGHFLPPAELNKFLAKYNAIKNGEDFDESDYHENKLTEENKGFKMLQGMGWNEGAGLGSSGQGITKPINQGASAGDKKGLGINAPHNLEQTDDEFDAYRKRMMMAYKFRPNPLNNPRRAYY